MNSDSSKSRIEQFQKRFQKSLETRKKAKKVSNVSKQYVHSTSPHTSRKRKIEHSPLAKTDTKKRKLILKQNTENKENDSSALNEMPPDFESEHVYTKAIAANGDEEVQLLIEEFKQRPEKIAKIKRGKSKQAVLERFRRNAKQKRVEMQTKTRKTKQTKKLKPLNVAKKEALEQSTSQLEVVRNFRATMMGKYRCSGNYSVRQKSVMKKPRSSSTSCGPNSENTCSFSAPTHVRSPSFEIIQVSPPKNVVQEGDLPVKKGNTVDIDDSSDISEESESMKVSLPPPPLACDESSTELPLNVDDDTISNSNIESDHSSRSPSPDSPQEKPKKWKVLSQTNYLIRKYQKFKSTDDSSSPKSPLTEEMLTFRDILLHLLEVSEGLILTLENRFETLQAIDAEQKITQHQVSELARRLGIPPELSISPVSLPNGSTFTPVLSEESVRTRGSPFISCAPSCERELFPKASSLHMESPSPVTGTVCGMPHHSPGFAFGDTEGTPHALNVSRELMWNG
eukprot:CAMPEP_0117443598 /NCGR_PEP_ID=MMETSP0759-20121206/4777_1 /TAXON_ID=63605 /ORGANISM="Percolomonas cosmopolitus, Strain WS" /LENGTH=510 /DNA_ID=CAMNT_0005235577 /DNA_START=72 /DNA_END=1604 /DNA_ORIENTATION=+